MKSSLIHIRHKIFSSGHNKNYNPDLGADKLIAAEQNGRKIAVEIKSFINTSAITDFHLAIGQFINYRTALKLDQPDRKLILAMPEIAYDILFQKEFPNIIVKEYQVELLIYSSENEVIVKWIP